MGQPRKAAKARKLHGRELGSLRHTTGSHGGEYAGFLGTSMFKPAELKRAKVPVNRFAVANDSIREEYIRHSSFSTNTLSTTQSSTVLPPVDDNERRKWVIYVKYLKLLLLGMPKGQAKEMISQEENVSARTL